MICKKCNLDKQLFDFTKSKRCKNGVCKTCKKCSNEYTKNWKRKHKDRLAFKRRKKYAETKGLEVKMREQNRKKLYPLRCRCQIMRQGMSTRSKKSNREFDKDFFTVKYLINRLIKYSKCECCDKELDFSFKKNNCFNDDSPSIDRVDPKKGYTKNNVAILCWDCNKHKHDSDSKKLRMIADYIDFWGDKL